MVTGRAPDALERCVGDVVHFAEHHWGRAPLHRSLGDALDDVMNVDDLDQILTSVARRPEVRIVDRGQVVEPGRFCTTLRIGGRIVDDAVDPAKLVDRLHEGATVVLQSLHRTWPSASRFAAELEGLVCHPVQINAYLTPPGAAGLAPHRDEHDVIVRQLHGTKRWTVEGMGDLVLEPGDCLYLPSGTRHSASTQADTSLHLTIGIVRITYRSVIQRLLAENPLLDEPLPLGWARRPGDQRFVDEVAGALDRAAKTLDAAHPHAVAERERQRRRGRAHTGGWFSSLLRLDQLDLTSTVRRRHGHVATITTLDAETIRLQLADRALRLPARAAPALEQLGTAEALRVGDLEGIDTASKITLVRRLVREGWLIVDA